MCLTREHCRRGTPLYSLPACFTLEMFAKSHCCRGTWGIPWLVCAASFTQRALYQLQKKKLPIPDPENGTPTAESSSWLLRANRQNYRVTGFDFQNYWSPLALALPFPSISLRVSWSLCFRGRSWSEEEEGFWQRARGTLGIKTHWLREGSPRSWGFCTSRGRMHIHDSKHFWMLLEKYFTWTSDPSWHSSRLLALWCMENLPTPKHPLKHIRRNAQSSNPWGSGTDFWTESQG